MVDDNEQVVIIKLIGRDFSMLALQSLHVVDGSANPDTARRSHQMSNWIPLSGWAPERALVQIPWKGLLPERFLHAFRYCLRTVPPVCAEKAEGSPAVVNCVWNFEVPFCLRVLFGGSPCTSVI